VINRLIKLRIDRKDKRKVYKWLDEFTDENEKRWRSTHAIASHTNLTEDRIRNICSKHKKIIRSDKQKEAWGIIGIAR